jgi:hypothetical protein
VRARRTRRTTSSRGPPSATAARTASSNAPGTISGRSNLADWSRTITSL